MRRVWKANGGNTRGGRRVGAAFVLSASIALSGGACGSDESGQSRVCAPGATQTCVTLSGDGVQVCAADGQRWEACESVGGAGGATDAGVDATAGSGGTGSGADAGLDGADVGSGGMDSELVLGPKDGVYCFGFSTCALGKSCQIASQDTLRCGDGCTTACGGACSSNAECQDGKQCYSGSCAWLCALPPGEDLCVQSGMKCHFVGHAAVGVCVGSQAS